MTVALVATVTVCLPMIVKHRRTTRDFLDAVEDVKWALEAVRLDDTPENRDALKSALRRMKEVQSRM